MSSSVTETTVKVKKRNQLLNFKELRENVDRFVNNQNVVVEAFMKTAFGVLQGGGLGYLMGALMESSAKTMNNPGSGASPMMAQMQAAGGPIGQAKSLAALCGVSSGLSVVLKKMRDGKDDVWTQMIASAGGGAAFTVASGTYSVPAIVNSALVLGLVTGGFYKVTEKFKPQYDEKEFEKSEFLLKSLGFSQYSKNLKKGLLTDDTIMLWNDSALNEVKIPPGPRLLILHHINELRHAQDDRTTKRKLAVGRTSDKKVTSDITKTKEP
eukprot:g2394.t1